eukprot:352057-Chlamydomonas_euryale.AAC.3
MPLRLPQLYRLSACRQSIGQLQVEIAAVVGSQTWEECSWFVRCQTQLQRERALLREAERGSGNAAGAAALSITAATAASERRCGIIDDCAASAAAAQRRQRVAAVCIGCGSVQLVCGGNLGVGLGAAVAHRARWAGEPAGSTTGAPPAGNGVWRTLLCRCGQGVWKAETMRSTTTKAKTTTITTTTTAITCMELPAVVRSRSCGTAPVNI